MLEWEQNISNGGSPLTQFKLFWDYNGYATAIKTIASDTNSATVTTLDGLVTGESYSFKVVSSNFIGDSVASGILESVVAGSLPSQPLQFKRAVSVTPVDSKISIQWEAPSSNGGSPLTGYEIKWNGGSIGGTTPLDYLTTTASTITFHTQTGVTRS